MVVINMGNEVIKFYSSKVICSEVDPNSDTITAKFCICDFEPNKNSVKINRGTIENWVSTLQHKPLLGKIELKTDGTMDFMGHNMKKIVTTDEDGNETVDYVFDTSAFGTFTEVSIEEIDGVEYIVAVAEIWKRFTKACEIILNRIENGNLNTSWEISVSKSHNVTQSGKKVKVIDEGLFIGHTLLGQEIAPAYDSSKLLEVASEENNDTELADALSKDMLMLSDINSIKKEDDILGKTKADEVVLNSENEKDTGLTASENKENDTPEISALTEYDLRNKIREACRNKIDNYCWVAFHFPIDREVWCEVYDRASELDYLKFTYEVNDSDEITVSDPVEVKLTVSVAEFNTKIAELTEEVEKKNDALVESAATIQSLNTEISQLSPFKEEFQKLEQERIANELAEKQSNLKLIATKSGLISEDEIENSAEIKDMIEKLEEASIKSLIAERYLKSLEEKSEEKPEVETSTANTTTKQNNIKLNLADDEEKIDHRSIMNKYIR